MAKTNKRTCTAWATKKIAVNERMWTIGESGIKQHSLMRELTVRAPPTIGTHGVTKAADFAPSCCLTVGSGPDKAALDGTAFRSDQNRVPPPRPAWAILGPSR